MKKMMMILAMMFAIATSASAMSYRQAQIQALFLADKMAYELYLTDEQHEAAYEINLDYLMSVKDRRHVYGPYWTRRNSLLRIVLAPWQYKVYINANYFYRPVYWADNGWRWRIYSRYNSNKYYKRHPSAYRKYRGGRPARYYQNRTWRHPSRPSKIGRDDVYMRGNGHSRQFGNGNKARQKMMKDARKFDKKMDKAYSKGKKNHKSHDQGNHHGWRR
jgi:hypothetical protein